MFTGASLSESRTEVPDLLVEWLSGNRSSSISWRNTKTGSSVFHEIALETPTANVEIANQAQDGKAYYAMASVSGTAQMKSYTHRSHL